MPPAVDIPIPVSVIIPDYNSGTALAQCLQSRSMPDDLNLRWWQRNSVASCSLAGVLRYGRAGRL